MFFFSLVREFDIGFNGGWGYKWLIFDEVLGRVAMFGKKWVEKMRKVLGERDKKCDRRKSLSLS